MNTNTINMDICFNEFVPDEYWILELGLWHAKKDLTSTTHTSTKTVRKIDRLPFDSTSISHRKRVTLEEFTEIRRTNFNVELIKIPIHGIALITQKLYDNCSKKDSDLTVKSFIEQLSLHLYSNVLIDQQLWENEICRPAHSKTPAEEVTPIFPEWIDTSSIPNYTMLLHDSRKVPFAIHDKNGLL